MYRIPALIYIGDQKLLAFAEKRTALSDESTVELDMRTGEVNKNESTHEVTIKVIICSNWFIGILLVKILFLTFNIHTKFILLFTHLFFILVVRAKTCEGGTS